jgi:hypothetical protein
MLFLGPTLCFAGFLGISASWVVQETRDDQCEEANFYSFSNDEGDDKYFFSPFFNGNYGGVSCILVYIYLHRGSIRTRGIIFFSPVELQNCDFFMGGTKNKYE